ncbi:uncharacterized protein LOC142334804 isoform X4 [Convolutriloba macropyga]|uniref:uncharacterized protein LOC142334804 isoform X4 n=1 Tax=Convolutriloba macropyga TaxID=536237 RepID=UPI003F51D208
MSQEFNTTKSIRKHNSLKKPKDRSTSKHTSSKLSDKVTLEKVLGLTVKCNSHIVVHESSHQCAYLAGSVVVILHSKTNRQTHVVNACRKTLSAVDFLNDGSHIATGEAGHQPAVRVWNIEASVVSENGGYGVQVAELLGHHFGIPIVAFAPHTSLLVSVGSQHDQEINVWNWRNGLKVASNKVSAKVQTVSFSEDGKWFVTCGVRHVRFWYIEKSSKNLNVEPLKGKGALLGEKKTLSFCDVATGKGLKAGSCFAVSKEGILCEFNGKRNLTKWVDLTTSAAHCLSVGKKYIYCGCANGSIRVFEVLSLDYLCTFPKPHFLGAQVAACTESAHLTSHPDDAKYPDCVAVQLDETNQKLYACYNDHSLYIWDVFNLFRIGKYSSFLFHSGPVRDVKMYPALELSGPLPSGSFLTCSNDNTMRVWNLYPHATLSGTTYEPNVYSNELLDIVYIDTEHLVDKESAKQQQQQQGSGFALNSIHSGSYAVLPTESGQQDEYKAGLRCLALTDTGTHIAAGDLMGNVRIYDAAMLHKGEWVTLEAHNSEVLSLEYSPSYIQPPMLATASRDRLLHVLSLENNYDLLKTLPDHSSSITGVMFNELRNGTIQLVSCAFDKSLVFRNVAVGQNSVHFSREHIVAEKTTFYDLTLDLEQNLYATACQDRNIRFYDCETSKLVKTIKGSEAEDGNINRLCFDPTYSYIATCCSDKTISLIDKHSGEIVTTVFGHSESITGLAFTNDSKRLISTCGDSCIFVWKLSSQLTHNLNHPSHVFGRASEVSQYSITSSQSGGLSSSFRGRTMSESVKPAISQAILLDDDDSELPAWFRTKNNSCQNQKEGGSGWNAMSSSLGGLNTAPVEEVLTKTGSRWADRATENLTSMATSIHVPSAGEEFDAHKFFTENLDVKRCHSGSESNASVCSSTNLADDKVANSAGSGLNLDLTLASPQSNCDQFQIEDIEISSPDPEDEQSGPGNKRMSQSENTLAASIRPSDLSIGSKPVKGAERQTPSVETQPIPIFVPPKGPKVQTGLNPAEYGDDQEGVPSKVNITNISQLSPDSVDKDDNTTSEDQDSISDKQQQDRRSKRRGGGFNSKGASSSKTSLDRSGGSCRTLVPPTATGEDEEEEEEEGATEDDDLDEDENFGDAEESNNDGDAEEDDNISEPKEADLSVQEVRIKRGRRDSLTNQHLKRMTDQQLLACNSELAREVEQTKRNLKLDKPTNFKSKLGRLKQIMKNKPILAPKKSISDMQNDGMPAVNEYGFTQSENFEIVPAMGAIGVKGREMAPGAVSTTEHAGGGAVKKHFGRTHLTPDGKKVLSSNSMSVGRPFSLDVSAECNPDLSTTGKTKSSMKEVPPASKQSPLMSDSRHRVLKKPHHGADKTTRDRSQDAPAVGASGSTTLKRRGAINESKGSTSGAGDKGSERPPDANNSKPQSIRRFKSDNNLSKRPQPQKPNTGTSGTNVNNRQSVVTNVEHTAAASVSTGTRHTSLASSTSNESAAAQPGYAKATRSSNLKTTSSNSGSSSTLHKSGLTSSNTNNNMNADLSEDSLDERSTASCAASYKPKRMTKAPLQKYANARSAAEKKKMKTWKSADSLYQGTLLANQRNGIILDEDRRQKEPTETEETKLASPPLGSNKSGVSSGNFLTPTNPVELCNSASGSSMSGSATVGTTAPCFFCIRKETAMDDDEGFVSNEYRYERCVCLPEQLLRMRPPKNTDPGLSDSDLDDSDTRSGSDYFVSQQDLNLAGCQRAVNRLNHSFKVVSGYHQQAEFSDERDEIIQLLTDTCSQISQTMLSRGMLHQQEQLSLFGQQRLGPDQLQQLRHKVTQLPPAIQTHSSRNMRAGGSGDAENSATLNLLQHYSDLLVNLVQQQLSTKELGGTSSSETTSISATVSYNDMQATQDDFGSEAAIDEPLSSVGVSHAASNETLEDI